MLAVREQPLSARGPLSGRALGGGDLIVGKDQASAIGTLIERQTRTVRLLHPPAPPRRGLARCPNRTVGGSAARPATVDHLGPGHGNGPPPGDRSRSLGAPVYFCDSHSPWQRGSNENMNGLLRDYFPKGTDLAPPHPPAHLLAVENELNNRPRLVLNHQSPATLLAALLASEIHAVLRRWLEPALP